MSLITTITAAENAGIITVTLNANPTVDTNSMVFIGAGENDNSPITIAADVFAETSAGSGAWVATVFAGDKTGNLVAKYEDGNSSNDADSDASTDPEASFSIGTAPDNINPIITIVDQQGGTASEPAEVTIRILDNGANLVGTEIVVQTNFDNNEHKWSVPADAITNLAAGSYTMSVCPSSGFLAPIGA